MRSAANDRRAGSAQVARAAAEAFLALPESETGRAIDVLLAGHPSMASLWRLATDVLAAETPAGGAEAFLNRLGEDDAAATVAARALPPWVLTISYSSSVLAALSQARLRLVACMESLPGGEGARMAEAVSEWARARVVPDEEALRQVPGGAVVVGCDALTPDAVVNKVKTRAIAEAARLKEVPCYAVAGATKLVSVALPVDGPFEATPLELFTAIAAPEGLLAPAEAAAAARGSDLHPDLLPALARLRAR